MLHKIDIVTEENRKCLHNYSIVLELFVDVVVVVVVVVVDVVVIGPINCIQSAFVYMQSGNYICENIFLTVPFMWPNVDHVPVILFMLVCSVVVKVCN